MRTLFYDHPEIIRLKSEIKESLIMSESTKELSKDLSAKYLDIAKSDMELVYSLQDIRHDGKRELWLPEVKPIPEIDVNKVVGDLSILDSGQVWSPCGVCGYTGLYQYTDTYATFLCYNPPCRSWYEIYKNQLCWQCNNPSYYRYYYDNRVAPHVRCVTQWTQCMWCSNHTDRTYYWYYD